MHLPFLSPCSPLALPSLGQLSQELFNSRGVNPVLARANLPTPIVSSRTPTPNGLPLPLPYALCQELISVLVRVGGGVLARVNTPTPISSSHTPTAFPSPYSHDPVRALSGGRLPSNRNPFALPLRSRPYSPGSWSASGAWTPVSPASAVLYSEAPHSG